MIVANEIRLKYELIAPHITKLKEQVDNILFNYVICLRIESKGTSFFK